MKIEVVVACISGGLAIVGVTIAVWGQVRVTETQAHLGAEAITRQTEIAALNTNLERRFQRRTPFLERQLTLYLEASASAAKIATLSDGSEREAAKQRFRELYWGELAVVEDPGVERAMVAFGTVLRSEQANQPNSDSLLRAALDLAHAARDSLKTSWDADLGTLQNLREP